MSLVRAYFEALFGLRVVLDPSLPESIVPREAIRLDPLGRDAMQTRGRCCTASSMRAFPADAMALVAFTRTDLFPEPSWNFVFGQSSFADRVAVYSLARLGKLTASGDEARAAKRRILHVASHELAHAFSIRHCLAFECVMNGSNSLGELDRQVLRPCPVCLAKLSEATGTSATARVRAATVVLRDAG